MSPYNLYIILHTFSHIYKMGEKALLSLFCKYSWLIEENLKSMNYISALCRYDREVSSGTRRDA